MATFSSAVMVGIRWKDWNTMPIWAPRKRARVSSSIRPREVPSPIVTLARLRTFKSGQNHQQGRFTRTRRTGEANPFGVTYMERDVFENMDPCGAAAEAQVDTLKVDRHVMFPFRGEPHMESAAVPRQSQSLGAGHIFVAGALALLLAVGLPGAALAKTIRLVALGDSLTAGYRLPPSEAFPVVLEKKDGPMLGSCDLELLAPIGVETTYTVAGTIESLVEKSGRKIGRFDILRIRLEVSEPSGELAATCTPSMILPRR